MARTGRRAHGAASGAAGGKSPATTRDAILAAARAVFGESGYEGASMRAIATAAGVDAALISHYFGSKAHLFVAAMEVQFDIEAVRQKVVAGPQEHLGERVVRFFLSIWEDPLRRQVLLGMVRSATTDEAAATMVRRTVIEGAVLPLVAETGVTDSAYRATLVGSQLMGLALMRYILRVEPLASAPVEDLVAAVGPTLQGYIAGPLDRGTDAE